MESRLKTNKIGRSYLEVFYSGGIADANREIEKEEKGKMKMEKCFIDGKEATGDEMLNASATGRELGLARNTVLANLRNYGRGRRNG